MRRKLLKTEVITMYGGSCVCCGVTDEIFLCFDHVEPVKLSKDTRPWGGTQQLSDAKKRFGDGYYQLLCFNCNFAKSQEGCPHQDT